MSRCKYFRQLNGRGVCLHQKSHPQQGYPLFVLPSNFCETCKIKDIECQPRPLIPFLIRDQLPTVQAVLEGPGTNLKKLFEQLDVKSGGCGGCQSLLSQMNREGPKWCRDNLDYLVEKIKENKKVAGINWLDLLAMGGKAWKLGLPLTLKGLIVKAIEDWEATQQS